MTINQTVSEQMREFDSYRNYDGSEYGSYLHASIRGFIHSYTRKLIEALGEEMKDIVALHRLSAWSPQDKDLELISKGSKTTADAITDDIDLKVKEIINQISK